MSRHPLAGLVVAVVFAGGCTTAPPEPSTNLDRSATTARLLAVDALAALAVQGGAPRTGYDRDQFGPAWADVDANSCSTREDVLRRDLTNQTLGPDGCTVLAGTLDDPYSSATITFTRGPDTSADVQVDHVVSMSNAWQTGAQQLDPSTRAAFANDPLNLLATGGPLNQQKGGGDAATWLPPEKAYRCDYVARQVAVKTTYQLWVTPPERDAINSILVTCPDQPLPTSTSTVSAAGSAEGSEAPFRSCAEARAAGAAPLRNDHPRFSAVLDGDSDGTACE